MEKKKYDDDSDDGWDVVETSAEAAEILHSTIFDFAAIILKICIKDEAKYPKKYEGKSKPSIKIKLMTSLMKCWDNNKERLAEHYVNYVLNWKKYIDERNEKFFLENDHIYPNAPKEDIEFFRDLWRPNSTYHLNKVEKNSVFEYFDIMIHYSAEWKRLKNYVAVWEKKNEVD